jgi:hypothetical protein
VRFVVWPSMMGYWQRDVQPHDDAPQFAATPHCSVSRRVQRQTLSYACMSRKKVCVQQAIELSLSRVVITNSGSMVLWFF